MVLGAVIQDYLPKRKFGGVNTAARAGLGLATVLSLYGCYSFNTNDVGVTEFTRRLWFVLTALISLTGRTKRNSLIRHSFISK
jgi:hypothetical protein